MTKPINLSRSKYISHACVQNEVSSITTNFIPILGLKGSCKFKVTFVASKLPEFAYVCAL